MNLKYKAAGAEAQFQPGSRGRVLRNSLGIVRVSDMNRAESQALELAQASAIELYGPNHRFTAADIRKLHRLWLGPIYPWAGSYRSVNIGKGGFQFAHAPRIPKLMSELSRGLLRESTPCRPTSDSELARLLAQVHAEVVLIHPFRDGNGRVARLLALLMALQAGLPPLNFRVLSGKGKREYIAAIHASLSRDYGPLTAIFERVIMHSRKSAVSSKSRIP
jgi:cell filamentation protein